MAGPANLALLALACVRPTAGGARPGSSGPPGPLAGPSSCDGGVGSCVRPRSEHVLLQQRVRGCHTTTEGEQCYAAVTWAIEHGIFDYPEHYPGLVPSSTFEEFQAVIRGTNPDACPMPCDLCHTAVQGEACYDAVEWARHDGIRLHPGWYPGLNSGSSFEEFQAVLHKGDKDDCLMPCNLCRNVTESDDPCYTDLMWAMEYGIYKHPQWYPDLTNESSRAEFQAYLSTQTRCPLPCGRCHTAIPGELCYEGVTWAMEHGIVIHPEWYPGLSANSSFTAFQARLHAGRNQTCPEPCGE